MIMTMRRTPTTVAVAAALLASSGRPRWSYEVAAELGIDRGSVYTILRRMTGAGWLNDYWEAPESAIDRPRRHLYVTSAKGLRELAMLVEHRVSSAA
jgi:DNA-binding PadR family transcriptional regulator